MSLIHALISQHLETNSNDSKRNENNFFVKKIILLLLDKLKK